MRQFQRIPDRTGEYRKAIALRVRKVDREIGSWSLLRPNPFQYFLLPIRERAAFLKLFCDALDKPLFPLRQAAPFILNIRDPLLDYLLGLGHFDSTFLVFSIRASMIRFSLAQS